MSCSSVYKFSSVAVATCLAIALFGTSVAEAACPAADQALANKQYADAISAFDACVANDGQPDDYYKLATLYYKGLGLDAPDPSSSIQYYRMAANLGYAPAQAFLGLILFEGKGTEPNKVEGYSWLLLAADTPENKWFYTRDTADTPKAAQYVQQKEPAMSEEELAMARVQADMFKDGVISSLAHTHYTDEEYNVFMEAYNSGDDVRKEDIIKNLKFKINASNAQ